MKGRRGIEGFKGYLPILRKEEYRDGRKWNGDKIRMGY